MENETSDIPEILTNKNEASTAIPLLPKDEYTLTVKSVTLGKSSKGGQLIKIKLATTQDAKDSLGKETLKAGFPLFDQISLEETESYDKNAIQRRLKTFRAAVTGDKTNAPFFPLQQYEGGTVKANVSILPPKDGFEEKNTVRYVLPRS